MDMELFNGLLEMHVKETNEWHRVLLQQAIGEVYMAAGMREQLRDLRELVARVEASDSALAWEAKMLLKQYPHPSQPADSPTEEVGS